jgi:hypothetical protein
VRIIEDYAVAALTGGETALRWRVRLSKVGSRSRIAALMAGNDRLFGVPF